MTFYSCPKCKEISFEAMECDVCGLKHVEMKTKQITDNMYLDYLLVMLFNLKTSLENDIIIGATKNY
jgi:hypothetical protein